MKDATINAAAVHRPSLRPESNRRAVDIVNKIIARRRLLAAFALFGSLVLTGGCSKQSRKSRILVDAAHAIEAGDYGRAEIDYRSALLLVPLDPTAIAQLGRLYLTEGRARQAYPFLKKGVELSPSDPSLGIQLAADELALGGAKEARASVVKLLPLVPASADAWLVLVESSRLPKDRADAQALAASLQRNNSDCAGFHLVRGYFALPQDPAGAAAEFRRALALDPKLPAAHAALASTFALLRELPAAGAELKTAAELAPLRSPWRLRYLEYQLQSGPAGAGRKDLGDLIVQAPDYIPALILQMRVALTDRRYADCAAAVGQILSRDPGNFEGLMGKGNLALAQDQVAAAIAAFKAADQAFPHFPLVQHQLGVSYLRNGETPLAEERLKAAVKADPNYAPSALVLAELEITLGRPASAVAILSDALQREPHIEQAYLVLGRAQAALRNPGGAQDAYRRLAVLYPKDPQGPYRSGLIALEQKNPAEARRDFERALALAPTDGAAAEMIVNLDVAEQHPEAARARIAQWKNQFPQSGAPWLLAAKLDLAEHRPEAAQTDLLKAIELDPSSPSAPLLLSRVYLAGHHTAEAERELTALVAKNKTIPALMQLASLHLGQRNVSAAHADFEAILSINPRSVLALSNLAWLELDNPGQLTSAEKHLRRAQELAPDEPHVQEVMGWLEVKKGDYRSAVPLLQESARQWPTSGDAQYRLGVAHYFLGDEAAARALFLKAIALAPAASPEAMASRARLAWLDLNPLPPVSTARSELETHLRDEPNDPVALIRLAAIEARQNEPKLAADHYRAAIKQAPGNAATDLQLAELYAGPLADPVQARDWAKGAHELAPNDPATTLTLGRLMAAAGDYTWSLDLLRQAAAQLPNDAGINYELAWASYRTGKIAEAESTLANPTASPSPAQQSSMDRLAGMIAAGKSPQSAAQAAPAAAALLKADPAYLPALMVCGLAREQAGDFGAAAEIDAAMLAEDRYFTPAAEHLAVADYRLGKFSEAAAVLRDSLRRGAQEPQLIFYYGMSLYRLKQPDSAKTQLRRAIAAGLSANQAAEASQALKALGQ